MDGKQVKKTLIVGDVIPVVKDGLEVASVLNLKKVGSFRTDIDRTVNVGVTVTVNGIVDMD